MTRSFCRLGSGVRCALLALNLVFATFYVDAQTIPPRKFAVQLSATVQESPARVNLGWPNDGDANGYEIFRRTLDGGWQSVGNTGGGATAWSDSSVSPGTPYEYQVVKRTSGNYTGYGYIRSGIKVQPADLRGKLILLVEHSIANALGGEIEQLRRDLIREGWVVLRQNVSAGDSPGSVKNIIRNAYNSDPANVKAVFLLGHVPVPYSGNITPDGHENHRGAWPADVFYGEMDGNWTDSSVHSVQAEREVNRNVPGDGKFDQSVIPSTVELMVGRVDLSNMTCYANKTPARSEVDLTRAYLNKLHRFRVGDLAVPRRGLICDNFSDKGADPIGGSAWRNFSTFFGANNVTEVGWDGFIPAATSDSYLWSFASGGGSYYYSMGVGTSDDFALKNLRVIFTMFMGSYFGDWNNESNFLRAALGSGDVLTASYSGFPHTFYFPMALGEPIGYSTLISQNNATNGLYRPYNQGTSQVHVSLHGDPTLRAFPVKPAGNLSIATEPGTARLNWSASPDSNIAGYYLYRATSADGPYERIGSLVTGTTSSDTPAAGTYTYMVRAVKLEQSSSGTFYNPAIGITAGATVTGTVQQVPGAPALSADVASSSRVNLQWTDVANETGYKIERKTGSGGTYAEIASVAAGTTSHASEGLAASTEYFFRVRAFNGAGFSPYSSEIRAVTHAAPQPQPPVAPALQANAFSHAQVNLTWTDVANEQGYKLERKTGNTGVYAEISTFGPNITTFANNGLAASTEYFYRVRAFNQDGHSSYSGEVRAVTPAAPQPQASLAFVEEDSTTQGAWPQKFGVEGYSIAYGAANLSAGRQINLTGKADYVWQPSTTDARALLAGPNASDRIASAWYGDAIVLNVSVLTDNPRRFALYFLDWDRQGRAQKVEVFDSATGVLLDSREVAGFGDGRYLVYELRGQVQIKVTKTAGPNALVMGAFFGGPVGGPISNDPLRISLIRGARGGLLLGIAGAEGQRFRVESTVDFQNWSEVASGTVTPGLRLPISMEQGRPGEFFRTINLP